MAIEPFALRVAVSRKQRGVNVKKHEFQHPGGIDPLPELTHDGVELPECVIVHPVEEPGWGRLGSKRFFPKDGRQHEVMTKFIGAVVLIIIAEDLVDHLQQVFVILVDTEQGRIIGFETIFQQCFKTEGMEEFLYQEEISVGRKLPPSKFTINCLLHLS